MNLNTRKLTQYIELWLCKYQLLFICISMADSASCHGFECEDKSIINLNLRWSV